jgi:hypothetical protein
MRATLTQPQQNVQEFTAVEVEGEQYSGGTLLVTAYAALWFVLMGWILLLWLKQAALGTRLDALEAAIDRAAPPAPQPAKKNKETLPETPRAKAEGDKV